MVVVAFVPEDNGDETLDPLVHELQKTINRAVFESITVDSNDPTVKDACDAFKRTLEANVFKTRQGYFDAMSFHISDRFGNYYSPENKLSSMEKVIFWPGEKVVVYELVYSTHNYTAPPTICSMTSQAPDWFILHHLREHRLIPMHIFENIQSHWTDMQRKRTSAMVHRQSSILMILESDTVGIVIKWIDDNDLMPFALTCRMALVACRKEAEVHKRPMWLTYFNTSKSRMSWALTCAISNNQTETDTTPRKEFLQRWTFVAAEAGYLELLLEHGIGLWSEITQGAALGGHIRILEYAKANRHRWSKLVCSYAAKGNKLEVLKYVRKNGAEYTGKTGQVAAKHGHLELLKYAHSDGCALNAFICSEAAKGGHLDVLKYAHENGCLWDEDTCKEAARHGHLECLKYARINGCRWSKSTCRVAAANNRLELLRYAHEEGCEWDERTCSSAAQYGHLSVLMYAHENGCEWDEDTCVYAAQSGHLEVLAYALSKGCPRNTYICSKAAEKGHLNVLKFAYENGCSWNEETCRAAVESGDLDVLEYVRDKGCPWNSETCNEAARSGYLAMLKYAHDNGCPWDEETCTNAAMNGYFECLKYAHENGCPWNESTCNAAATFGCLQCLKYAHENGCPWDKMTCFRVALAHDFNEIINYIYEKEAMIWRLESSLL